MELDLILEPDLSPAQISELGLLAEQLGFRGIWAQNYSSARDAFMSLVPLAQSSNRIRIGVVILCPYEMHPMKIANTTLTLNEYANGRAMVVIGSGGEWPEVMDSKVFTQSYSERMNSVADTLRIVTKAGKSSAVAYKGESYSALRFDTSWHKADSPLVYHGACGPRMLKMGVAIADGAMMSDVMPAMFSKRLPILQQAITTQNFRLSNFIAWHVRKDKQQSYAEARRELIIRGWLDRDWLEPFLNPEETKAILDNRWPFLKAWIERHGNIEGVPNHVTDTLVKELSLAGDFSSIDRHVERLKQFSQAGFTEIALRIHEDPAESMQLIAERVLPEIH